MKHLNCFGQVTAAAVPMDVAQIVKTVAHVVDAVRGVLGVVVTSAVHPHRLVVVTTTAVKAMKPAVDMDAVLENAVLAILVVLMGISVVQEEGK